MSQKYVHTCTDALKLNRLEPSFKVKNYLTSAYYIRSSTSENTSKKKRNRTKQQRMKMAESQQKYYINKKYSDPQCVLILVMPNIRSECSKYIFLFIKFCRRGHVSHMCFICVLQIHGEKQIEDSQVPL